MGLLGLLLVDATIAICNIDSFSNSHFDGLQREYQYQTTCQCILHQSINPNAEPILHAQEELKEVMSVSNSDEGTRELTISTFGSSSGSPSSRGNSRRTSGSKQSRSRSSRGWRSTSGQSSIPRRFLLSPTHLDRRGDGRELSFWRRDSGGSGEFSRTGNVSFSNWFGSGSGDGSRGESERSSFGRRSVRRDGSSISSRSRNHSSGFVRS